MEKEERCDHYQIRYVKLHFTLEFTEDTVLPRYKASALRGGIGEMLLRSNCVRDRKCETCDFETECIVRRTMYSKMEIQPSFMTSGDSVGYVLECEDYHRTFSQGDLMNFCLILFGKTIAYFSQFLNAVYVLGMSGIGKNNSHFRIRSVTNSKKIPILMEHNIVMENYEILTIHDYIGYRREQIAGKPLEGVIKFQSPLCLKYQKEILKRFEIEAVLAGICRRIYILDCFEGIDVSLEEIGQDIKTQLPVVLQEEHHSVSTKRYSNRRERSMPLEGIEGSIRVTEIPERLLNLFLAGELIHIGKNTSFGFGRYRLI